MSPHGGRIFPYAKCHRESRPFVRTEIMAALKVKRSGVVLRPDSARVFFRPFDPPTRERVLRVIARVVGMTEREAEREIGRIMRDFADRHQKLRDYLQCRFEDVREHVISDRPLSPNRQLLIGAYFTQEYSLEAAALFNPSIVPHPDQGELAAGRLRFVLSLRATGEGHISSIVFRTGEVDGEGRITMNAPTPFVTAARPEPNPSYERPLFERKLAELGLLDDAAVDVLDALGAAFTQAQLQAECDRAVRRAGSTRGQLEQTMRGMLVLARSNYVVRFDPASRFSERVIFPHTPAESRGIEDARFVEFRHDDGSTCYYATYAAYDGRIALPQILETRDFLDFHISTLNGPEVRNKGFALFPRKVNGHYAMLSRQDNEHMFLMYSDLLHFWHEKRMLLRPTYAWEFVQLGNCGSPIETDAGWLVLTHGVGAMRRYTMGAILLDRDDPARVIGRLPEPLMVPTAVEREGYVPNVVYSCGALVHAGLLLIPYAMSDECAGFASVPLADVLAELREHPSPLP